MKNNVVLWILILFFANSCTNVSSDFNIINLGRDVYLLPSSKVLPDSLFAKGNPGRSVSYRVTLPSTVFNGLLQNGLYKDIFVGTNLKNVNREQFESPWWFVKEFKTTKNKHSFLVLEGINYYADIWLNGHKIADSSHIKNPFRQFVIPVDYYLYNGENRLAIKIYPPRPGDFNIGFVDWNPKAPDNEMGIVRPVKLKQTGEVALFDPYVYSHLSGDNEFADLYVSFRIRNLEDRPVKSKIIINISGLKPVKFKIKLDPQADTTIVLTPAQYGQLHVKNPALWWPHNLGKPHLYAFDIKAFVKNGLSDRLRFKFGIRDVKKFRTKQGFKGFKVNGKKVLIRGGGWVDNLFLNNTRENILAQLQYVKDMGLNTIRLEGFWGNSQTLYDLCDSMGIMIMAGWSCQWEWENYLGKPVDEKYGGIITKQDIALMTDAWHDQIVWLRNHPSIIAWFGASDKLPHPDFERQMLGVLQEYDSSRVFLSSAQEHVSTVTGYSGIKMRGPYEVVPPVYWYQDTAYGGAFGFNSETGPGAQVPPLESIKKFIPPDHLWPIDEVWEYHCGRGEFGNLDRYNQALFARYGAVDNVADYAYRAQVMNYELIRPMFEAFALNRFKSTGIVQWMLNSAWPEFYWQLYDYYLMPNGAYFGTKKANQPVNPVFNYADSGIYVINNTVNNFKDLRLNLKVLDLQSDIILQKTIPVDELDAGQAVSVMYLPDLSGTKKSGVYFVNLVVQDDTLAGRNFYWISAKPDKLDYANSQWYYTPFKEYADFTALDNLARTKVSYRYTEAYQSAGTYHMTYELANEGKSVAFFISLKLFDQNGQVVLPVRWEDNYFSLLPGEKRLVRVSFPAYDGLNPQNVQLQINFWNK